MRVVRLCLFVAAIALSWWPSDAAAQTPQRGKLTVTVTDSTGGVIPGATVTVVGLEPGTKEPLVPPAQTTDKGVATFPDLPVGRYSIRADFPGFDIGLLRDFRLNRGDNNHVVVLPLKNMSESVTVAVDSQVAGSDREANSFGLSVTQSQIEALSDDPAEMARQIAD